VLTVGEPGTMLQLDHSEFIMHNCSVKIAEYFKYRYPLTWYDNCVPKNGCVTQICATFLVLLPIIFIEKTINFNSIHFSPLKILIFCFRQIFFHPHLK
jgi:hypothetical protein